MGSRDPHPQGLEQHHPNWCWGGVPTAMSSLGGHRGAQVLGGSRTFWLVDDAADTGPHTGSSTDSSPPPEALAQPQPPPHPVPHPWDGFTSLGWFYEREMQAGGGGVGGETGSCSKGHPSLPTSQTSRGERQMDISLGGGREEDPGGGLPAPFPCRPPPTRLRTAARGPGKVSRPFSRGPAAISINSQLSRPAKNNHRPSS